MGRILKRLRFLKSKRFWASLVILGTLSAGLILLKSYLERPVVFTEFPQLKAEWEVEPVFSNIIGSPITAVLKITAPRGVVFNFQSLPEVGELFSTPGVKGPPQQRSPYPDYGNEYGDSYIVPPEPVLEVRQRSIRQYSQEGGLVVTEVVYTLQYLFPLDFTEPPGLTERKVAGPTIRYEYLYQSQGKAPRLQKNSLTAPSFTIYIAQQVQEGDVPYGLRPPRPVPFNWGGLFKILGAGTIFFSILFWILKRAWDVLKRRKSQARKDIEEPALLPPTIEELWSKIQVLYQNWQKEGRYETFEEAVKEYRNIPKAKEGLWGPRKNISLWEKTTLVLYSGRRLSSLEIEEVFKKILEEKNV